MKLKYRNFSAILGCGVAAAALVPAAAMAQKSPDDAGASAAPIEIVVTAQKRSEKAQDIPKSVEVVTQQTLTDAGVTSLADLSRVIPSIQGSSSENTGAPPAIRGISSFAYSIGVQAQTGVVLDDIAQPNFSTLADELGDIDRVEVLPGPQSTLSGRNAAGGLINLTTRTPSSTLTADFTGEITNDRQKRIVGYISGPVAENVGFSLSGYWDDWSGPLNNLTTGHHVGGWDRFGLRSKFRFELSDKLTATVTAYYAQNDAPTTGLVAAYPYVALGANVYSYFIGAAPIADILPYTAKAYNHDIASDEGGLTSKDYGGTVRLDYDSALGTISSISNVTSSHQDSQTPIIGPLPYVAQNYNVDHLTQEFRLASPSAMHNLKYLLGLYYTDTQIDEYYNRQIIGPVDWDRRAGIQSLAVYGNATYELLPKTFVTGGLRYQHDRTNYNWRFIDLSAPNSANHNAYDFVAGEASVRHEFDRDFSVYATYANAQTGRAYDLEDNVHAATPDGLTPLASEKVQSVEGGFKSQWLNRHLTLNLSAFDAWYSNYQVQNAYLPIGASIPSILLFSIGKVETRGLELDAAYAVTRDLKLTAAATLMDAKIKSYPNAICYNGQSPSTCIGGVQDLAGAQMPGASHFKAVVTANYTLRMPDMPFDATIDALVRYQSGMHTDVTNDPASHVNGYGIVNLAVGLKSHNGMAEVQIFANNLFDKQYYAALAQDTVTYDTGSPPTNPAAVYGSYARDSRRYGGIRLKFHY